MFICTFDPFRKGLPVYSFTSRCNEADDIRLTDGTERRFFNCTSKAEDIPEDLRKLYDYIMDGTVSNELTGKIDEAVTRSRRNEEWRSYYMKELLHDDDVREEAKAEGIEIGRADGIEIGHSQGIADGIRLFIQDKLEDGIAQNVILDKLMRIYSLTKEAAEQYLDNFNK